MLYCEGKNNHIADALSRYPVFDPEEEDTKDILACTVVARRSTEAKEEKVQTDLAMEVLKKYAEADQEYVKIYEAIRDRKDFAVLPDDHPVKGFKDYWDALSIEQTLPGLVMYHGRIWVPEKARASIMEKLHLDHSGPDRCVQKAKSYYFWQNMAKDIRCLIANCDKCLT